MLKPFLYILCLMCAFSVLGHESDTLHGGFRFYENTGQWVENFRYKADLSSGWLYLHDNKLVFDLYDQQQIRQIMAFKNEGHLSGKAVSTLVNHHAYSMAFVGAQTPLMEAFEPSAAYYNFYLGNDSSRWRSSQPAYSSVKMSQLYKGIDFLISGRNHNLKYEFYIAAGADPSVIKIEYAGIDKIKLVNGNLILFTSVGNIVELAPVCFQGDDRAKIVPCRFVLQGKTLSYQFPEGYDRSQVLIIDPTVVFASYSGSTADNWGYTATYDREGNLYAGGNVFNNGYPTTIGAYQTSYSNNVDIVLSKYTATGNSLVYSTYLGGSGPEVPASIIVNEADELYVMSVVGSSNFPTTTGAYDNSFSGGTAYTLTYVINYSAGSDIALTCFSASGSTLLGSSFVGGTGNDGLNMATVLKKNYADDVRGEVLLDENSNVYIVSSTASLDFPTTTGVVQQTFGGGSQDGVIAKFDRLLTTLQWATYLGGSMEDAIYNISLTDASVYVCGGTVSSDFPVTPGVLGASYNGGITDGFVTKMDLNGSFIQRSSFWGTAAYDQVYFVETDKQSNVYLFGQTASSGSEMILNAGWYTSGGGQFISKLNPDLSAIVWSTRFGTSPGVINISPTAFLVDYCKNIYLSGWGSPGLNGFGGTSGLPTTAGAFQTSTDNSDYYFLSIRDDASGIVFGSFYGGSSAEHVDGGTSRFDRLGKIYQSVCAGCGGYDDFPTTPGAWSNTNNASNCNNGVIKLDFNIPAVVADFTQPPVICLPASMNFTNTSYKPHPATTSCFWNFGDGTSSTDCNPTHIYSQSGVYNVTLIMTDFGSCNTSDTIVKQVVVLSNSEVSIDTVSVCSGNAIPIGILPIPGNGITYQWQPSNYLSNSHISNPIATPPVSMNYRLIISNGVCTDTVNQWVEVYNLQIDAGSPFSSCSLGAPLVAVASGGTDFSFHWSSNPSFSDTLNDFPDDSIGHTNFSTGHTYYLMVSNGFCQRIDSVFVDIQPINPLLNIANPLCNGDSNGFISSFPTGGVAPYAFVWSTGDHTSLISNLPAGTYYLTITDALNCHFNDTIVLLDPPPLTANPTATTANCDNACNAAITLEVSGGTPPYSYLWNNGSMANPNTGLCQGIYHVTVSDLFHCKYLTDDTVMVDYIYSNVDAWADQYTIYQGQSTIIHATPINGVNYSWTPDYALSSPYAANSMASPEVGTTYTVVFDDGYGCLMNDSLRIEVLEVLCYEPYIYIPNSFTPNGDGQNDILRVRSNYIKDLHLVIFNRWGEKVFETNNPDEGWNGTFRGVLLDPAVFDYYIEVTCYNKNVFKKKGNITLLR